MANREDVVALQRKVKRCRSTGASVPRPADISTEERELVRRLCAGDEAAFEAMVRKHSPRMLAVARRYLPHEEDARDAVQNALLSAMRGIKRFVHQSQLATWLHRIVVNAALMELRNRRRRLEDSIEEYLPHFDSDGHWINEDPDSATAGHLPVERRETREMVRACIARLPESYRTILLMRDIEDLDTEEIARLVGASTNAIKVRIHRARQALRPIIEDELRGRASARSALTD
jgi:RNA polymerase sigma-70 factor, ECF subfamily